MKKISSFLIQYRKLCFVVMLFLTILCGFLATGVPINRDRSKYLSDQSNMKKGMTLMENELPASEENSSIRVMFHNLKPEEIEKVQAQLEDIPNVSSVTYEADDPDYQKDSYTLFVLNSKAAYGTAEELSMEQTLDKDFSDYEMVYRNNDIPSTTVPFWIIGFSLSLGIVILIIMSRSWLDAPLFLTTLGMAVTINFGTNFFLPFIDEITVTIGPILQLVLSMDYSVILMSRYRQEKPLYKDRIRAMKVALAGSISSIASSSLTTVAGLLALVFLSFKLGPELGIVLAKGVFVSMLCVFSILPALILAFDPWLEKTRKKSLHVPLGSFATPVHKARYFLSAFFILLLVGSFFLQRKTAITFTETNGDPVVKIFPKKNTIALLYRTEEEKNVPDLIDTIEKDPRVLEVLGYTNTLGKEMSPKEMSEAFRSLNPDFPSDERMLRLIYFLSSGRKLPKLTATEFLNYLTGTILPDKSFSKYMDPALKERASELTEFSDKKKLTTELTAEEMAGFLGIEKEQAKQLYLYEKIVHGISDSGRMSLPEFISFIQKDVRKDPAYASYFDASTYASLDQAAFFTDANTILTERSAEDIAALLGLDANYARLIYRLYAAGDVSGQTMTLPEFSSYLVSLSNDPVLSGFIPDKNALRQAEQLNSLIALASSGRELSSGEMAEALGIGPEQTADLYRLYFVSDPETLQEAAAMQLSLPDFLNLLKAYGGSEENAERIAQLEQLTGLAVSGQELDVVTMAGIVGIDKETVGYLYAMQGTDRMTLPNFVNAALQMDTENPELQQLNQLIQLTASNAPLDSSALASLFNMQQADVEQLFALSLSADKKLPLMVFSSFLTNSILPNPAYAQAIPGDMAGQIRRLDNLLQTAVSGTPMGITDLSAAFGISVENIQTIFRLYAGSRVSGQTMSLKSLCDFLLSDDLLRSQLQESDIEQLQMLQSLMNISLRGDRFTSPEMAGFLGLDRNAVEKLYILRMSKNGAGDAWTLSPEAFISFALSDVLNNPEFQDAFSTDAADDLRKAKVLMEAVLSGKKYTADEMTRLLSSLSSESKKEDMELLYRFYDADHEKNAAVKMTIPELLNYLADHILKDERFSTYFDKKTRSEIEKGRNRILDYIAAMRGEEYSRLVINSSYPDESRETYAFTDMLQKEVKDRLGESYLIGNSMMVSEIHQTFQKEYLMISFITAFSVFLVVLLAFRNPTLPLILTLLVQCGVFITVTIIGLYAGSMYYLSLLIVQSILMGATIDYGIVFSNFYRDYRKKTGPIPSLRASYDGASDTIMTSGSILVLVLAVLGVLASSRMISDVCITLSLGVLIAILLILFILPGLAASFDPLISRSSARHRSNDR